MSLLPIMRKALICYLILQQGKCKWVDITVTGDSKMTIYLIGYLTLKTYSA